ncbi:unnamed protein product [Rhodiola kirilowii]
MKQSRIHRQSAYAIMDDLGNSASPSQHLAPLKEVTEKLENLRGMLKQLHTQL